LEGGLDVAWGRGVGEQGPCEMVLHSGITRFRLSLERG
jgi:hypothetical protein